MEFLVDCIVKLPNPFDPHYGIQELGGPENGNGNRWRATRADVIVSIHSGHRFFTQAGSTRSYLFVVNGSHGEYLKTHTDGTPNDNLLYQRNPCLPLGF